MARRLIVDWLEDHRSYPHDWCLVWPFATLHGYGQFGIKGKTHYAHRYMCELVHGAPPTERHQAAHSCGNGHKGCVNPRHLSWKTPSENQLDCKDHGTQAKNPYGNHGVLTHDKAATIRSLKGIKLQRELADEYGVSESTISDIWLGRTWTKPHKNVYWTDEDDATLVALLNDGLKHEDIAKIMDRGKYAISVRAAKKGFKSRRGSQGRLLPVTPEQGASDNG
jgi:hypothetical protein